MAEITVYGAPWCPDCHRTKQFLCELRVPYAWVDIEKEPEAAAFVRQKNNGKQIIPTVVFADGSFLAEPDNDELARKLGVVRKAERSFYDLIRDRRRPPPASPPPFTLPAKGSIVSSSKRAPSAGRPGSPSVSITTPAFRRGSVGQSWPSASSSRRAVTTWNCSRASAR